jgi:hypothetical protein
MKVHDCVQLSPEWFEARRGIPTASNFDRIITPKTMKLASAADDYIAELIAEVFHIGPLSDLQTPMSRAMLHGVDSEPAARAFYSLETGCDVQQVGFITTDDGRAGSSPDGLVGDEGCIEIKCPQGKAHVVYLLAGGLPSEYRGQVHGNLLVTGLAWCDFLSYCEGLPPLLVRVTADAFTAALRAALEQFHERYQTALQKIRSL